MTRLRLRSPEFGTSRCEWLEARDPAVLAHCCRGEKSSVIAVHNLSEREVETTIELGRKVEGLFDLLKNCEDHVDGDGRQRGRGSRVNQAKNSSRPRLYTRRVIGEETLSSTSDFSRRHSAARSAKTKSVI